MDNPNAVEFRPRTAFIAEIPGLVEVVLTGLRFAVRAEMADYLYGRRGARWPGADRQG